jgi:chromosome segregation ATPase
MTDIPALCRELRRYAETGAPKHIIDLLFDAAAALESSQKERELAPWIAENLKLEARVAELERERDEAERGLRNLSKLVAELTDNLDAHRARVAELEAERGALRKRVEDWRQKYYMIARFGEE